MSPLPCTRRGSHGDGPHLLLPAVGSGPGAVRAEGSRIRRGETEADGAAGRGGGRAAPGPGEGPERGCPALQRAEPGLGGAASRPSRAEPSRAAEGRRAPPPPPAEPGGPAGTGPRSSPRC